ncbi:MAG: hypothetical protein AAF092_06400 [Pseudomonadota bacterium]
MAFELARPQVFICHRNLVATSDRAPTTRLARAGVAAAEGGFGPLGTSGAAASWVQGRSVLSDVLLANTIVGRSVLCCATAGGVEMAGPQFVHLQTFSLKANKAGQSVQQVLDEAARRPEFSQHVDEPQAPNIIEGLAPTQVLEMHNEIVGAGFVEVAMKDGSTARRGIRRDRHTLLTAVACYPVPRHLVGEDQAASDAYKRWVEFNVRWLKGQFGDKLVSIIEHVDEQHPHLHAFVLPLDDTGCNARRLNPAWLVKEEAEALAKDSGKPAQEAVKFGNRAYRAKGREIQDHYFQEVGLPSGLTRAGPKRERLSREQWRQRKEQARRDARLHREMENRVEELSELQEALENATERKAIELAEKMALVDQAHQEAEEAKKRIIRQSRAEVDTAKQEANLLRQKVREELAVKVAKAEAHRAELEQAGRAFELEKRRVVKRVVVDVAKATVRVLTGVFNGTVQLDPKKSSFVIADKSLARSVEDYGIRSYLEKPVTAVLSFWQKISSFVPLDQVASLEHDLSEEIGPVSPSPDQGAEP